MAMAYHMEALRKQRVIDRKYELIAQQSDVIKAPCQPDNQITDIGRSQAREQLSQARLENHGVVFERVIHDANFNYRVLKDSRYPPIHVDQIYPLMYPH